MCNVAKPGTSRSYQFNQIDETSQILAGRCQGMEEREHGGKRKVGLKVIHRDGEYVYVGLRTDHEMCI
jgi:hypothetical protein